MELERNGEEWVLKKEGRVIGGCILRAENGSWRMESMHIVPQWRRRGYGSYLLKEALRAAGGYRPEAFFRCAVPLPDDSAENAFWARFGFVPDGGELVREHRPDPTAVALAQELLTARLPKGGFAIDATCGNGHDTEFLCRAVGPQGRVLALDIQPAAVESTRARLAAAGWHNARVECADHAALDTLAAPKSADCVMFNFGWLPGASHQVYSAAGSSIPALRAALTLLRPGGVLSAVLYSGKVIGNTEKLAVLDWLKSLPITEYTVIVCAFANWADTAPLPCIVVRK